MKARLFARYGPEEGLEVEIGAEATLGRAAENTIQLSSREVSQRHARVFFDADSGVYWVEDLGSLNGTRLDGETVSGRRRLGRLHVLGLGGEAELFFITLDLAAQEVEAETGGKPGGETRIDADSPSPPAVPDRQPPREGTRVDREAPTLPPALQASSAADTQGATRVEESPADLPPVLAGDGTRARRAAPGRFVLEVGGEVGGRFVLRDGDNLVGRSGRARVTLSHRELSRRHATLRVEGDRVWVRDEGSRNHTWVGDRRVEGEVELEIGSELRFGRLEARLVAAGAAGEEPA